MHHYYTLIIYVKQVTR